MDAGSARWSPGDQILLRHLCQERVVRAVPLTVVDDGSQGLAAWVAPGTEQIYPFGRGADGVVLPPCQWQLERRPWWGEGMLELTRPDRASAIRLFWDAQGLFEGWYVNLQAPIRRRARGYDTSDWQLDLWINADGTVTWKDEVDVEAAVAAGFLQPDEASCARWEAERVLSEWPFPTGWESWRPDEKWPLPSLPADWAALP